MEEPPVTPQTYCCLQIDRSTYTYIYNVYIKYTHMYTYVYVYYICVKYILNIFFLLHIKHNLSRDMCMYI